ncbi:hypothetical protein Q7P37_000533 [Cladosporium fusiforme]
MTTPPPKTPWPPETGIWATYALSCHCAAIQYTMRISPPLLASEAAGKEVYTAIECECTHCETKGQISCHPKMENVVFTQGLAHRNTYLTASRNNPHWFCALCGSTLGTDLTWLTENVFHDGEPRCTINLRMLKDVRPQELTVRKESYMRDV